MYLKKVNGAMLKLILKMKIYAIIFAFLLCAVEGVAGESRKIIIRGDNAFPPYEFINDKGEPDGFNVDLVRAVMEELKLSYDIQLEDWSTVLRQFNNNEVDLITGVAKSNIPSENFELSLAYSYVDYIFVCRKNNPILDAKDLSKKSIIVQKHTLPYKKMKDMNYDANFIVVDNMVEGLKKLSEGEGDVAICINKMAHYIIYKNGLTNLSIHDSGWPLREYCFAGSDPQLLEQVNAAVVKLKNNGIYDRIHMKWLGGKPVFTVPSWVYFLIGALILTALLLSIFISIYKKRIKRGEILLKNENEKLNDLLLENKKWLNRYLTVFNTTLVGLCYYDKNGILLNINDEMLKLFQTDGKRRLQDKTVSIYEDPLLRSYGIVDEKGQIHEFHGVLKYDLRKEKCPEFFARFSPYDQIYYLKMDVTPIISPDGELEGTLITAVDQTAEVNHEKEMRDQETKLDLAMDAGNVSAWIYEPQNQEIKTLRGNALAGKGLSMEENLSILHPDDHAMQKELFDVLLRGEKEKAETIFRYMSEDGTYHYYESRMIVKKEEDRVVAILGSQKDITKEVFNNKVLNDTVEKLRFAIQTAGIAMWEFDCKTRIFTSYNDPIADYEDGAPITIETYDSYYQKDGTDWDLVEKAARILESGQDESYSFQVKMKTKYDSDWQYCTVRGVPMEKDKTGRVIKYLGVRLNITEQINYQKFLEQEREDARQADKLKSAFLANMSHEIRTPLNAIVGFSELLQTTEDAETRKEFIDIINNNNELLLRLIGDILDLSKIESGLLELKPEVFDMAVAYKETFTALKQRCTNPDVEFVGRNPYKSCKVKLDRNRLVQVGTNFITNAIKHTSQGHILMGYEYVDGGMKVYVEDTGCGIAEEKQCKLFERFAKLDDFTQGTGLGLAICKAIVDAQGGKIGVESSEGKGSTFWAWFPCEAEIEEFGEAESIDDKKLEMISGQDTDKSEDTPKNSVRRKAILVAEDIDSNYMLVKAILKTFDLTRAKTGKEAVEMASRYRYDAILMDMKMPVMNGIDATRMIREFDKVTPIIAVTANAFDSDRVEALEAGCDAFVAKPLKKKELEEVLGD